MIIKRWLFFHRPDLMILSFCLFVDEKITDKPNRTSIPSPFYSLSPSKNHYLKYIIQFIFTVLYIDKQYLNLFCVLKFT